MSGRQPLLLVVQARSRSSGTLCEMQPRDALDRLLVLLRDSGVTVASDNDKFSGPGIDACTVWEAFCDLACEPALEPFDDYGEQLVVGDDPDCDLLTADVVRRDPGDFVLECGRYFSFYDKDDSYAGTSALRLEVEFAAQSVSASRLNGYAGRRRDDVDDSEHPEFAHWAGWVPSWKAAVETNEPFRQALQAPAAFHLSQSDV